MNCCASSAAKRRTLIPWTRDPFGRAGSQEKSEFSKFRCWPISDMPQFLLGVRYRGINGHCASRAAPSVMDRGSTGTGRRAFRTTPAKDSTSRRPRRHPAFRRRQACDLRTGRTSHKNVERRPILKTDTCQSHFSVLRATLFRVKSKQ